MCCVCCVSVVIQSNADIPPLAEETILFLDNKIVLGKVLTFYHKLHSVRQHMYSYCQQFNCCLLLYVQILFFLLAF